MASRRMFSKTITESDDFTDMPLSTQALYFHLNMTADDDGFINNSKRIQRMIGASDDDIKLLWTKNYIIPFESGVVAVRDWRVHNYIPKDRYRPTLYQAEKAQLAQSETCIQSVYKTYTQNRLGEDSIGKESTGEMREYSPFPTHAEIIDFCSSENLNYVNHEVFFNHYQARAWKYPDGTPVSDWKAEARKWNAKDKEKKQKNNDFSGRNTVYGDNLFADTNNLEV